MKVYLIFFEPLNTADANVKVEDYEEGNKAPNAEDFSAINDPLTDDSSSSSSDDENDDKKTDIKAETIKKESSPISESIKTEISKCSCTLFLTIMRRYLIKSG